MRYKASDTSDAANKARLNVDEKYFNKCRREMLSVVASGLAKIVFVTSLKLLHRFASLSVI